MCVCVCVLKPRIYLAGYCCLTLFISGDLGIILAVQKKYFAGFTIPYQCLVPGSCIYLNSIKIPVINVTPRPNEGHQLKVGLQVLLIPGAGSVSNHK